MVYFLIGFPGSLINIFPLPQQIVLIAGFARILVHPMQYYPQILILKRKTKNYPGGGFLFTENRSELTLYKVILIMEGDSIFTKCGFGLKNCSNTKPCPLHDKYTILRDGFHDIARTETIESLAKKILNNKAVLNTTSVF